MKNWGARGEAIKVPDGVMGSWARSRGPQGRWRDLDFFTDLSLEHQINPRSGICSVVQAFIRPSVRAITYAPSVFSRGLIGYCLINHGYFIINRWY